MGARLASLAMYRDPPEIADATCELWAYLRERLRAAGMDDVPEALDDTMVHDAAWLDPRLLLAQTCGYPLATRLRGRVRLVATPVYNHPGCEGALNGSFVIVRADAGVSSVAELRGGVAAINDWTSNSGMNLLRHTAAPHAVDGRFFGRVVESGSHRASLALVARGEVDVAAIDCVTFGNMARFSPETVSGVRVLAETAKTPGLPLITRAATSDADVEKLRAALQAFARDPAAAPLRDRLGLRGFELLPKTAYAAVLDIEQAALALAYPALA
ncbi:MAG: phosphate/phosphite/phosphonate ABC transporter substrate-binding protein [Novosphingobium sp.]